MGNLLYKILLTINSTSLIVTVYLIKAEIDCLNLVRKILPFSNLPIWLSYFIYFLIPVLLTGLSLLLARFLSKDSIKGQISEVEQANNSFLPSYLGYFFVALSVGKFETLIFVFLILFFFTFFSQTLYFNPLFLIWGYQFYYIKKSNNMKIFIISKKSIRDIENIKFHNLRRINNFTYLDFGGKDE